VFIDPARFKQVLYNYLSKALKFTPEGGHVEIRVRPQGKRNFRLEFEDTGIGIRPQDIDRLFVEFQQLDAALTKKHPGTGLGLALTKRLVEAQGGSVGVRSVLGQGSVFHAILPLADDPTSENVRLMCDGDDPDAAAVLVVDADPREQTMIARLLLEAGYQVDVARSGAEARQKLESGRFDAMTLDLGLPDIGSLDLLERIRSDARNVRVPVLVLTAKELTPEEHLRLRESADAVLFKLVTAAALREELESALKRVELRQGVPS
jgi:CheY-like chemotaxis protein